MGQKVHPYGFRLGVNKPWKSRWFVERGYDKLLVEDVKLKAELREKLKAAGVSSVEAERPGNKLRLIIRTARPGIIIGRKGAEIDKLKADIQKRTRVRYSSTFSRSTSPSWMRNWSPKTSRCNWRSGSASAARCARAVDSALRFGCKGIKVRVSGRLERQRDRAFGVVSAGPSAAAHAARGHRLRFLRGAHDLRHHRRQDLGVPRGYLRAEEAPRPGHRDRRVLGTVSW